MTQLEKLKNIIVAHKGKKNRITSAQTANLLGISEDDTHAKTRALILDCAEKFEIPLAANNSGYYVISSDQEYNDYIENLETRKSGIDRRIKIIKDNYLKHKGE